MRRFSVPPGKQLQGPETFGIDPETAISALFWKMPATPGRTARVDIDPDTGKSSLDLQQFRQLVCWPEIRKCAHRLQRHASPEIRKTPKSSSILGLWTKTDCSIRIEGGAHRLSPGRRRCRKLPHPSQGQDADQRHSIWCIPIRKRSMAPDLLHCGPSRRRKLELAVEILPDVQIRWSPRRESVMLGEYLCSCSWDPIRFSSVEGKTLLFL